METKVCIKCKTLLDTSMFSKDKNRKDGYTNTCKICCKVYREENKAILKAKRQVYKEKNRESIAEYGRVYYSANKGKEE